MGIFALPDGYTECRRVNLQADKKLAVLVNGAAFAIAVVLFFIGNRMVAFDLFRAYERPVNALIGTLGLLVGAVVYIFAHELTHGVFIKRYSGKKAKYGFTGLYAYAGSDAFFNKWQYLIIALAPVVLFGLLFLALNLLLPSNCFWSIYFLQIFNLSGAAGDFYITGLMCKLPADVLANDEGFTMVIYARTGIERG